MREDFSDEETVCSACENSKSLFNFDDIREKGANSTNYADLYIVGRIWLAGLKTALLGFKLKMIPVIKAEEQSPPKKPPPMKYTELPVYKSPHYEYKQFIEDKTKCSEADVKLMRRFLLPYVTECRKQVQETTSKMSAATKETCQNVRASINETKRDIKAFMRSQENENIRKSVVVAGAGVGYLLGRGKGIPMRVFSTGAGAAAGGALCYPKETDEAFRNFSYYTGKTVLGFINWTCGKDLGWRERIPCKNDLPVTTGTVVPQCPPKK